MIIYKKVLYFIKKNDFIEKNDLWNKNFVKGFNVLYGESLYVCIYMFIV